MCWLQPTYIHGYIHISIYRYGILCVTLTYCSTNKRQICENIMQFSYYRINVATEYRIQALIDEMKKKILVSFYRQHQHSTKIDSIEIEQTTFFFLSCFLTLSACVVCIVTLVFLFFFFCNRVSRRNFCASHKFQFKFSLIYTITHNEFTFAQ